uniref:Uncharacterized protein n=1 Tax=Heterorhabditis bacteriophora TaxID=37862 RepID=A0A1I7WR00_HETBA
MIHTSIVIGKQTVVIYIGKIHYI